MRASAVATRKFAHRNSTSSLEPPKLRVFFGVVAVLGVSLCAVLMAGSWSELTTNAPVLLVWLSATVAVDLLPVRFGAHSWTVSVAVLLAAGMVFPPGIVGLLALVGSVDSREFRHEMSLQRALFNRAEVALSAIAASTVFHALATSPTVWPTAILAALGAVCADALVNYMLVGTGCGLLETNSYSAALPYVREKMLGSAPVEHFVNYLSLAVLGLVFATVYSFFGIWALLASLAPVAAVRQSFLNKKRSMAAEMEATRATELLTATAERMESEKKKDRERIAADLHDEVLPALFKVHLMGEVLKQDVDMGRLLDLDEDLPHLLEATDHAAGRMRALIATLRRSTTQTEGVTPTLGLLVQDIGQNSLAQIRLNAGDVCASPLTQLLIFQIAREALRNAVNHSDARWIDVQLKQDGLHAELTVSDDGKGFSLGDVDTSSHFGLSLMASRARLAGGSLDIRTRLGAGTVVVARVPLDAPVP